MTAAIIGMVYLTAQSMPRFLDFSPVDLRALWYTVFESDARFSATLPLVFVPLAIQALN
jgi:hypothetical protein